MENEGILLTCQFPPNHNVKFLGIDNRTLKLVGVWGKLIDGRYDVCDELFFDFLIYEYIIYFRDHWRIICNMVLWSCWLSRTNKYMALRYGVYMIEMLADILSLHNTSFHYHYKFTLIAIVIRLLFMFVKTFFS